MTWPFQIKDAASGVGVLWSVNYRGLWWHRVAKYVSRPRDNIITSNDRVTGSNLTTIYKALKGPDYSEEFAADRMITRHLEVELTLPAKMYVRCYRNVWLKSHALGRLEKAKQKQITPLSIESLSLLGVEPRGTVTDTGACLPHFGKISHL